jgi:hypothetical protein
MNKTEYACHEECGSTCVETYDSAWLVCPNCSRVSCDFKPPDFHLAADRDFPNVDGVEIAISWRASSIIEHACEY